MKTLIIASFLLLSACMSTQDIQNRNAAKCSSYGYREGTNAFGQCMSQMERQGQKESLCRQMYLSAFGTADPAKGFGYASAVGSKAQADCLLR